MQINLSEMPKKSNDEIVPGLMRGGVGAIVGVPASGRTSYALRLAGQAAAEGRKVLYVAYTNSEASVSGRVSSLVEGREFPSAELSKNLVVFINPDDLLADLVSKHAPDLIVADDDSTECDFDFLQSLCHAASDDRCAAVIAITHSKDDGVVSRARWIAHVHKMTQGEALWLTTNKQRHPRDRYVGVTQFRAMTDHWADTVRWHCFGPAGDLRFIKEIYKLDRDQTLPDQPFRPTIARIVELVRKD